MVFSLPFPDMPVTLRQATVEDSFGMFCTRMISCAQKAENEEPPSLAALQMRYAHHGYENVYRRMWEKPNIAFILATTPPNNAIPSFVQDSDGQAVLGFCGYHPEPDTSMFYIGQLFSIRSPYPTGRILMDHCIRTAKDLSAESIILHAAYLKTQQWYENTALFGSPTADDLIVFHTNKDKIMALYAESYDKALAHLRDPDTRPCPFDDGPPRG